MESNGSGVFTNLLIDALSGTAASLLGDGTPVLFYAHIEQSLGIWSQRAVFKTNVKTFVSLRETGPSIQLPDAHKLTDVFAKPTPKLQLDPSYEPERNGTEYYSIPPPNPGRFSSVM